jgi:hypothetical protein
LIAYERDTVIREEEFTLREKDFNEKSFEFEKRLIAREEFNSKIGKDFFHVRYEFEEKQKKASDENELLKIENETLSRQLDLEVQRTSEDCTYKVTNYEKKKDSFAGKYRKETKDNENNLMIIKEQYQQVQE